MHRILHVYAYVMIDKGCTSTLYNAHMTRIISNFRLYPIGDACEPCVHFS